MIYVKTAVFFAGITVSTLYLAGLKKEEITIVEDIFTKIGLLFQIQDDVLDIYGEKQRSKRACDIQEGKLSYFILTHIQNHPADASFIFKILNKERELTTDTDVKDILELFNQKQTLSLVMKEIKKMIDTIKQNAKQHQTLEGLINDFLNQIILPISHLF